MRKCECCLGLLLCLFIYESSDLLASMTHIQVHDYNYSKFWGSLGDTCNEIDDTGCNKSSSIFGIAESVEVTSR